MTPKQEAALRLAREALKKCDSALAEELAAWDIDPPLHHVLEASNACGPAIAAIDEVLAEQPAQQRESVATIIFGAKRGFADTPEWAYPTAQPASKPLTDEMSRRAAQIEDYSQRNLFITGWLHAEAAHGIKGDA